jgi:hypothetical protein
MKFTELVGGDKVFTNAISWGDILSIRFIKQYLFFL